MADSSMAPAASMGEAPPINPVSMLPLPVPGRKESPPLQFSLGVVDLRSPAEESEFQECESIVREGWNHFARVGAALLRIREKHLYKNEYHSFETYCRDRWNFGPSKVWGYISAAQVHQNLEAIPGIPLPECEAQVRPLTKLPAELAQQAWLDALGHSPNGHVSARSVHKAVQRLLTPVNPGTSESKLQAQRRYDKRCAIRKGFEEVLTLLVANGERDVLIEKVQALQRVVESALKPKKQKDKIQGS